MLVEYVSLKSLPVPFSTNDHKPITSAPRLRARNDTAEMMVTIESGNIVGEIV